jgi:hypothetical protein
LLTSGCTEALAAYAEGSLIGFEGVGVAVADGAARPCEAGMQCAEVYARESRERALALLFRRGPAALVFIDFIAVVQFVSLAFEFGACRLVKKRGGQFPLGRPPLQGFLVVAYQRLLPARRLL